MFFHGLKDYFIEMFLSFFFFLPKIHVPANLMWETAVHQIFLLSSLWDLSCWFTEGEMMDADRRLGVRTLSSMQPLKKGTFPAQPNTITSSPSHVQMQCAPHSHHPHSGPAHELGDRVVAELELQKYRNKGSERCPTIGYGLRSHVGRLGWGNNPRETTLQCQCLSGTSSYSNLVKPQLLLLLKLKNKTTPPSPVS